MAMLVFFIGMVVGAGCVLAGYAVARSESKKR